MLSQNTTRRATRAALMLALSMMAASCSGDGTSEPQSSAIAAPSHRAPSHHASLDDDPATCKSGYTLVDGHVVCN